MMDYYVIDSSRRVWANCATRKVAERALLRIQAQIRKGKFARAPDPNTLRVVHWRESEHLSRGVEAVRRIG